MKYSVLILILIQLSAHAQLDTHSQKGLSQTQSMLINKSEREKVVSKDPMAKEADAKASIIAGSHENKEEMYKLAAQVMEKIVRDSNGDVEKMKALMQEAQKDPAGFYQKNFTEEQKTKVREIAHKVESQPPSNSPKH